MYTLDTLPDNIKRNLPEPYREVWLKAFNDTYAETSDEFKSEQAAWGAVRKHSILAVKSTKDGEYIVPGWGMLFTDANEPDLDEEYFDDLTQLLLEYYADAPLWYEHGQDPTYGVKPIGKRRTVQVYPRGIYTEHILHPEHQHLQRTLREIENGELTLSSDSLSQYWLQDRTGRNTSWPIAGWSLTKTPAEPALGPVSIKSFAKHLRDLTAQAREAQTADNSTPFRIKRSKGTVVMNEEMLAQLAAFLGLDSADPTMLATRLRELASSLEGATEMDGETYDTMVEKQDSGEADLTDEEQQALETAKLVVSIKKAMQLPKKASYADVADELREVAKAIKAFMERDERVLDPDALEGFGQAWKAAKNTPEPDLPHQTDGDSDGDGSDGDGDDKPRRGRGGSNGTSGSGRKPAKSRTYGMPHFRMGQGAPKPTVGRVLQELYAYTMHRQPMKAQSYQLGSSGGLLLRHEIADDFIEVLRDKLILEQLGADFVPMDGQETLTLPKDKTEHEAYWVGEGTQIPESDEEVGGVTLYPKPLAARIIVPNKFLANARINYEQRVQAKAEYRINRALLYAALFGAGAKTGSNTGIEPAGLVTISAMSGRAVTGTEIGSGNGAKAKLSDIEDMIGRVEDANVEDDGSSGFALSPRAKRYFGNMKDSDGNYVLRGRASENIDPNFLGYPYADSNIIPNNQTVGTSTDCTTIVYGVWSNLKVGMSNAVEFLIDPYSLSSYLQTVIIANIYADVNVAHDEAFEVLTGARV